MVTAETLTLAALLIAPGVIAVLIGVTLGVVEEEINRDQFYLTSFISSIIIDIVFIWIIQTYGEERITDRSALESVFFAEEQFNVGAAVLLLILSCALGLVYGIALTYNISHHLRERIARFRSHQRNPWQPWEGGLRDSQQVMVQRKDGSDVIGMLSEYSRVGKERQILLQNPVFPEFEDESNRERVIIPEEEISLVHILSTRDREGIWDHASSLLHRSKERIMSFLSRSVDYMKTALNLGFR